MGPLLFRLPSPHTIFWRIERFSQIAARYPDVVRKGFAQSNASARTYSLLALRYFAADITPFTVEIAMMAVGGSKEVREAAEQFVAAAFRSLIEAKAAKGTQSAYSPKSAVQKHGPFLRRDLAVRRHRRLPKYFKICLGIRFRRRRTVDQMAVKTSILLQYHRCKVKARLDSSVFGELRACVEEYEKGSEEEFSLNEWARKQKAVFLPLPPDTSVRLFKELQELEITDGKVWPNLHQSRSGKTLGILQKFAAHPAFGF